MPKTEDEAPLTVEDILCVKGGRLGTKVVKVPIEYEDIDGVKIRIFRVRKRDCWLISPFINQTTASAKEKEVISATLVEIQAGFHKAILEKRRKQREKIGEAEEAAEGRAAVGLSSDEEAGKILFTGMVKDDETQRENKETLFVLRKKTQTIPVWLLLLPVGALLIGVSLQNYRTSVTMGL